MRTGTVMIIAGVVLALAGVLVRLGLFSWFGNLPGDIRIEGDRTSAFIPITSMIVVSLVGSVILNLATRLFGGE